MKVYHDRIYLDLLRDIFSKSNSKEDRTGTGTLSVFGRDMRFDLRDNIVPILTTKKMHIKSIVHELLWYLTGETNIKYLQENGVRIWNNWADENGDLGPVYGKQWRAWATPSGDYDQIQTAINTIRTDPDSRRIIVSAWNVSDLKEMALVPCHAFFQFYVVNNTLSCKLTQRSADVGLGVPFNIAQYSILTMMVAHVTGLYPGEFIWSGGDIHIYRNHIEILRNQMQRRPLASPTLWLNPDIREIDEFTFDDIKIEHYQSHPALKMEVSV